jgi:hypothetical protein
MATKGKFLPDSIISEEDIVKKVHSTYDARENKRSAPLGVPTACRYVGTNKTIAKEVEGRITLGPYFRYLEL